MYSLLNDIYWLGSVIWMFCILHFCYSIVLNLDFIPSNFSLVEGPILERSLWDQFQEFIKLDSSSPLRFYCRTFTFTLNWNGETSPSFSYYPQTGLPGSTCCWMPVTSLHSPTQICRPHICLWWFLPLPCILEFIEVPWHLLIWKMLCMGFSFLCLVALSFFTGNLKRSKDCAASTTLHLPGILLLSLFYGPRKRNSRRGSLICFRSCS